MIALLLVFLFADYILLLLLPGLAAAVSIAGWRELPPRYAVIVMVAASAVTGYLAFWIYFWNKTAGEVFSYGTIVAALVTVAVKWRHIMRVLRPLAAPLLYTIVAAVLYLSCFYLWVNPFRAGVDVANFRFFHDVRAGDNIIPFIFAEKIYDRQPVRPFCCGDWLSSDRPPLQAGIFLLQRPLRLGGPATLQYELLGTALQCLWLTGVWVLLGALNSSTRQVRQILGLLIFTGFLFYNSVYVWPKLLAATFVLFLYAIIGEAAIANRRVTQFEALLAALCLALALVAHPGSVFSLPALAVVVLVRRRMLTIRQWMLTAGLLAMVWVPWTLYQKLYDPPGNRLLKMHLAGLMNPDPRGTARAIRDAYRERDTTTILRFKWENITALIGPAPLEFIGDEARIAGRDFIWNALGILNIGWIVAVVHIVRRARTSFRYSGPLIGAAVMNLFVWALILFGPGETVTAHGSYADILLLSIGLAGLLLELPSWAKLGLVAVTAIDAVFVWVLFRPQGFLLPTRIFAPSVVQWPLAMLAVLAVSGLLWHFGKSYFERDTATK